MSSFSGVRVRGVPTRFPRRRATRIPAFLVGRGVWLNPQADAEGPAPQARAVQSSAASTVAPPPRASGCPMPRWPPLIFSPPHFTATGTTPSGHDSPQTDALPQGSVPKHGAPGPAGRSVWRALWLRRRLLRPLRAQLYPRRLGRRERAEEMSPAGRLKGPRSGGVVSAEPSQAGRPKFTRRSTKRRGAIPSRCALAMAPFAAPRETAGDTGCRDPQQRLTSSFAHLAAAFRQGLSGAGDVEAECDDRVSLSGGPERAPDGSGGRLAPTRGRDSRDRGRPSHRHGVRRSPKP